MEDFKVKPILRKDKKRQDGLCPIYIKVIIKRKNIKLPTNMLAEESVWNTKLGTFKEAASSIKNSLLKKQTSEIDTYLWQQVAAENEPTLEMVKNQFTKQKNSGFYVLLEECYQAKFREIKPGTQKHYLLVRKRLKQFQPNINLSDLNQKFLMKFENFLVKEGVGIDGIWQHHKILKSIINYGIKRKVIKNNPYIDFKVKKGKPRMETLTEDDIIVLKNLTFEEGARGKNTGLELTRDMFLFSCYTSLRYGDAVRLNKKNITKDNEGELQITMITEKTGSVVNVPLSDSAVQLIEKYSCAERDTIFPAKKNQVCNRDLKRIAELSGITTNLHFHLSRHTFGSLMASRLSAFDLSKTMGHSNIKTTMIYVNTNTSNIRKQMATSKIYY
ncbi:tyrosine-type recombinase/integrase [Flavobacterium sp. RNTU_13]|uniref:tyrosine-type recombinase/integrase n=1 Tax=Flavobacterium sp. RNTU_13 TaxID=3375145 RepID=UPI00398681C4